MPNRYSALQDVEARLSIDESETDDVYDDVKNEPKVLDVTRSSKISIVKKLGLLTLFAGYTALVFGLGHASVRPDGLHAQPSAALPYLQEKHLQSLPQSYDQIITFNGTLDYPSKFRGPPSPDIDRAWARSINLGAVNVSLSDNDMRLLGMDPDTSVKLPPEDGGAYRVHFEFSHQMHCVNFIRMWTYRDHYKEEQEEFMDSASMQRTHIDHCVEMIRQFVMCHADTNLVSTNWVAGSSLPHPNFNTKHTCRNFDAVVDWAWDHQITIRPASKPEGVKELASPP
ncbi:Protein of unknown function DUF3328 [Penicillium expansum]|uniref:Tat pathway signal sequence n=1 Tax=Penicillium expansum TaxID=27334 RepID=A0A0A2JPR0_PENEN|nr:Protein of unknown function DUF3328 [Penicillium expansum]KGO55314.1 Protein of unknown function DUF3328 [Penicillium expansum]KGO56826.1 Protein of unknown function DUF3328 [Penicillium expansum]